MISFSFKPNSLYFSTKVGILYEDLDLKTYSCFESGYLFVIVENYISKQKNKFECLSFYCLQKQKKFYLKKSYFEFLVNKTHGYIRIL